MDSNTLERAARIAKVAQAFVPEHDSVMVMNDRTRSLSAIEGIRWNRFCTGAQQGTVWPAQQVEEVVIRLDINKTAMRALLQVANSVVPEGAPIWIVGGNDEGIKSFSKTADGLVEEIETIEIKKRCRLLKTKSTGQRSALSALKIQHSLQIGDVARQWCSYPGVFSKGLIDAGTELLLRHIKAERPEAEWQMADFACGTGALAARLRQLYPNGHLDAIEADAWAMSATKENVPEALSLLSDGWRKVPFDRRYRLVVSNPPVHIGKETDYSILRGFLQGAIPRLHRNGEILMVLQGQVNLARLSGALYRNCDVVLEDRRYKVWRVSAPNR